MNARTFWLLRPKSRRHESTLLASLLTIKCPELAMKGGSRHGGDSIEPGPQKMNYQRLRYVFPGFTAGLVIVCLSGGSFIPRPAAAAELRDQESTAKKNEKAVENLKEPGVSDQETDAVKKEFGPNRPNLPQRGANLEREKPELHEHDSCEELHPSAAIEACKKRREQSR